ncbi:LysR family transcriptional regulator [Celeribacter sp.]|uniref:LysR family transcriptional regulator n=1 Tax=Celeribacter sp. TaxID=1890673 RepID=UPI003A8F485D
MPTENWDEIRTAYTVAKQGTVSGAAAELGVHHATVIRHVDALEERLGVKLFQRHARGYTPTEAGRDLLTVAQTTEDQISQLVSRIKGRGEYVSGELVVTSVPGYEDLIVPVLAEFQTLYPDVIVRLLTDERLFRLEYGEAHVAIRAGQPPQEPDNVVKLLYKQDVALCAHRNYFEAFGAPDPDDLINGLRFIGHDDASNRAPFLNWLKNNVPDERVTFRSTSARARQVAISAGVGVGFLPVDVIAADPDLSVVMPAIPDWEITLWVVTHVDLHRTAKVQAFTNLLRARVKDWSRGN